MQFGFRPIYFRQHRILSLHILRLAFKRHTITGFCIVWNLNFRDFLLSSFFTNSPPCLRGSSTAIMTDFLIWIQKPPQPLPHFPSRTMYEELHSSTATHINPTVLKLWLCHPYWFFGRFIWRRAYINARKRGNCTSSPVLRGREKKGYPPCPLLLIKWPDVPGCNRICLLLNWSWDLPSLFPTPRWSSKSPSVIKKCLQ